MDWKYFDHIVEGGETLAKADLDTCFPDDVPDFVSEYGCLPIECRRCWKPLIFWNYSKANVTRLKRMIASFPSSVSGKYNDSVVVFWVGDECKRDRLLGLLDTGILDFKVDGRIQWRVSCRGWQDGYPEFFVSAKQTGSILLRCKVW